MIENSPMPGKPWQLSQSSMVNQKGQAADKFNPWEEMQKGYTSSNQHPMTRQWPIFQ